MAKKKNKQIIRPWCWYCEREFEDEKVLMQHQKAKHFKCNLCPRRLNTAGGLAVHIQQVHKLEPENLPRIENALPGRDGYEVEIFGMEGIPAPDVADYKRRKEIELGLNPGTISQPPNKRPKTENRPLSEEELRAQLAAHRALMGAAEGANAGAGTSESPGGAVYGAPPQVYGAPPVPAVPTPVMSPPGMPPLPPGMGPPGMVPMPGMPGMPPPGMPPFPPPPFGVPGMPPFGMPPPGMMPPGAPPFAGAPPFPIPPGMSPPPPGASPPPGMPFPPLPAGAQRPPFPGPPPGPNFVPASTNASPPPPSIGGTPSSINTPQLGQQPPSEPTLPDPSLAQTNQPFKKPTTLKWSDANFSPEERRAIHPKYYFPKDITNTSSAPAQGGASMSTPAQGQEETRGKKRARAEDFL